MTIMRAIFNRTWHILLALVLSYPMAEIALAKMNRGCLYGDRVKEQIAKVEQRNLELHMQTARALREQELGHLQQAYKLHTRIAAEAEQNEKEALRIHYDVRKNGICPNTLYFKWKNKQ